MSEKLINTARISTQLEFDEYGGFKLMEVLDHEVLEAVGGGDITIPTPKLPDMQVVCKTTNECPTNYCEKPATPKPPAPAPAPTPPKEKPKAADEDGDEG